MRVDAFRIVAQHNAPPAYAELRRREPLVRGRFLLRVAETKQVVQIADVREDVASNPADKDAAAFAKVSGVRTLLEVPMLKDREVVGAIVIYRQEVRTFNDREIDLLKSFADQAVIAIENARLLSELRQRTDDLSQRTTDLSEALEQTATSDVLQVISSSPGELATVFDAVLQNATRICGANFGIMNFLEPGGVRAVAMHNVPEAFAEFIRRDPVVHFGPKHPLARTAATKQVVHIPDLEQDAGGDVVIAKFRELTGARTILHVPMLKDKELVGIVSIYRQEVRPFTDKQIDLVKSFAAQAVIAIENARLLNELRQRTGELAEALEQQMAASQVLQVISSFPGELEPVFARALENAVRICDAKWGTINRWEGDTVHLMAMHNLPPAFAEARRRTTLYRPRANALFGRMAASKSVVHIADVAADEGYLERDPDHVAAVELGGARTVLAVPMLKENELIGALAIVRQEVRPFTDKQIELVQNFAAQAVIAIENARLLNELRQRTDDLSQRTTDLSEALEQQTATSEILRVISSSQGDLQRVFENLLENATRLCGAKFGNLFLRTEDGFRYMAMHGVPSEYAELGKRLPQLAMAQHHPNVPLARMAREKKVVHIA